MPFYRKPRGFTPLPIVAETKSIKNGVHNAIFTSRFDRYVGDWTKDLKEGKGYFLKIGGKLYEGDWYKGFKVLATPVQLAKSDSLTEQDIQLDSRCVECIEEYVTANSAMKSQQEFALQGFREYYQQMIELSRGLKMAHGKCTYVEINK